MINAIGSLVLAAVVFTQWAKESQTADAMTKLRMEAATAREIAESEARRTADLQRDIDVLKQSFEATLRAAAEEQKRNGTTVMRGQLEDARGQVENWKDAVATRDNRIRELEADLITTRRRLDEAIVRIKQANAR